MKSFLFLSLSIIAIFMASSLDFSRSLISKTGTSPALISTSSPNSTSSTSSPVKMWTDGPAILYKNEILELHFAAPNAPFLGLVDPSGHFFYLVYPGESVSGDLKPMVESERFIGMNSLKINPDSFEADPYRYGVLTNQPVFTTSGKYTFILGENLHVDDPELLDRVVINYIHASRPAKTEAVVAMN